MKLILLLSRLITGVLFIFSGLIKANDPLGLSYKMQEFFEVWGWHSLKKASILRVHDVKQAVEAVRLVSSLV